MEQVKMYLSGGMGGLTYEEQVSWRNRFKNAIKFGDYDITKPPLFFSPPDYYYIGCDDYKTEKEVMEFDLYNLRKSDLIIVNFNIPKSIGTAMELMLAKEYNIPVIALKESNEEIHPWLLECCTRVCNTMREVVDHVVNFYLK